MKQISGISTTGPGAVESLLSKADQLRNKGDYKGALSILSPRLRMGDLDPRILERAAMCFFSLGDAGTAISLLKIMRERMPENAAIPAKLAGMQMAAGDSDAAVRNFKDALALDPFLVRALFGLYMLEPYEAGSEYAARLYELESRAGLAPKDAAVVFNTIGAIERQRGKPAAAMHYFSKSKEVLGAKFDPDEADLAIDLQTAIFSAGDAEEQPVDGPRMVFICGLPRSGTTLMETILTRHSKIGTIGESRALTNTLKEINRYCSEVGRGENLWSWFGSLSDKEISVFRQYYYAAALQGNDKGAVVVDKMPMNCLHLGLAHVLLPGAKFIFMSRHPLDVGLSIFSIAFDEPMPYGSRLDWLGRMTASVFRSAADYQQKLGSQMRVQSFEALLRNPETQTRSVLEHCGLEWEEACLTPGAPTGFVNTASQIQVRKEINFEGLGKWKSFEKQLQPLVEGLGGQRWVDEWQQMDRNAAYSGQFTAA